MLMTRSLRIETRRAPTRVLIVNDDPDASSVLEQVLSSEGFETATAATRNSAKEQANDIHPDVILLDRVLGGEDRIDVLVDLRRVQDFPVIMLGTDDEWDRVLGLRMGADDYVAKPLRYAELIARIQAVARRSRPQTAAESRVYGRLELNAQAHEVLVDGRPVDMTAREYSLLAFLAAAPRQVFTRDQLLERVWGSSSEWQDPRTVTEHIRRVRLKLTQASGQEGWISTLRGVGYRFEPPPAVPVAV